VLHFASELRVVREATVIIEYIDQKYRGAVRLIPEEPSAALDSRFMDRFFDNYIMTPTQKIVSSKIRPAGRGFEGVLHGLPIAVDVPLRAKRMPIFAHNFVRSNFCGTPQLEFFNRPQADLRHECARRDAAEHPNAAIFRSTSR
jgi:glutathione S-transferase